MVINHLLNGMILQVGYVPFGVSSFRPAFRRRRLWPLTGGMSIQFLGVDLKHNVLGPWESYGFDPWDESRYTGQLNQLNQLNVGQIYHI